MLEKYPFETAYYIPILIVFHTSVRIGEFLDLTWEDIDFDTNTITLSCKNVKIVFGSVLGYIKSIHVYYTQNTRRYSEYFFKKFANKNTDI